MLHTCFHMTIVTATYLLHISDTYQYYIGLAANVDMYCMYKAKAYHVTYRICIGYVTFLLGYILHVHVHWMVSFQKLHLTMCECSKRSLLVRNNLEVQSTKCLHMQAIPFQFCLSV